MAENEKPRRRVPLRHCKGCNAERPKGELLRVVRTPDGAVALDFTGRVSGRGVYICRDASCLRRAQKTKRLEHELGCPIPDEVFASLEAALAEGMKNND